MKKKLSLIFAVFCAFLFCACNTGVPVAETDKQVTPDVTAAPQPTPTPVPPKTLVLAYDAAEASGVFREAAADAAAQLGVQLEMAAVSDFAQDLPNLATSADAIIAYVSTEADTSGFASVSQKLPLCVYYAPQAAANPPSSSGYSLACYNLEHTMDALFDAVLNYDPHDTPVRIIELFESEQSPASVYYENLFMEGKVLPREKYTGGDDVEAWLSAKLQRYYEGMVDCIVAENETLARAAVRVLSALGRSDMEVFCAGVSEPTLRDMKANPDVFAVAVGANEAAAGELNILMALAMINGASPAVEVLDVCTVNAREIGENLAVAPDAKLSETLQKYRELATVK